MDAASASTIDVAGFRVERALGTDVWEAVQPELGRRVALRLVHGGFRAADWPEDPGVVPLLTVTETDAGTYVATRFVPGARTLAQRRGTAPEVARWLDEVAATLARVRHGDLTEHDILIGDDGHALLTGFGRGGDRDDREALAGMRPRVRRRWPLALLVPAAVVAFLLLRPGPTPAPPVTPGSTPVGSSLRPGGIRTVDCTGAQPSGASVACTIMQAGAAGSAPGVVRAWAVRGVRGTVALQVLVPAGDGYRTVHRSDPVHVSDPGAVRVVHDEKKVPRGARFALQVDPGTGIGVRGTSGRLQTFTGPLHDGARAPDRRTGHGELELRVDVIHP